MGKIVKTLPALKGIVNKLKKQGKRIVFTNGCFDIIHPGHIKTLKEAKSKGDVLIIGVNSDSSVREIKGRQRPILDEGARTQILAAISVVDYVIVYCEKTPHRLIKEIKPSVLVKGGDWQKEEIIGKEFVQKIYRVKLYPGYSTTKIIEKIKTLTFHAENKRYR